MKIVLFAYGLALLFMANANFVDNQFLSWLDWSIGVFYVIAGSVVGYQNAKS